MQAKRTLQSLAMAALFASAAVPAVALECPVPHPEAAGNALQETPAQIDKYSTVLAGGDTGNAVGVIMAELRQKHPDATTAQIVNFLVAAYCPALASQGYDGQVAATKIKEFTALVEARLLTPAGTAAQTD